MHVAATRPRPDTGRGAFTDRGGGFAEAQTKAPAITSPKQFFGFNIGDDYQLATYDQFVEYWHRIDKESNRMQVFEIGKTEEGRPHLAAIITAPENFAKLDRYKQISQQLHHARGDHRRAGARARQGRQGGRLDRRRPARDRSRRRASADRDGLSAREPDRRRDDADPARRHHHRRPRQSRRHADGVEVLHAERGSAGAPHLQPAPLQQVRGARRQPRLLHVEPEGIPEHEQS